MIELGDSVRIVGGQEVFAVVGTRDPSLYELQLGSDASSKIFKPENELELVAKAEGPKSEPGLIPTTSIMGEEF
jgi:hypothetical protein